MAVLEGWAVFDERGTPVPGLPPLIGFWRLSRCRYPAKEATGAQCFGVSGILPGQLPGFGLWVPAQRRGGILRRRLHGLRVSGSRVYYPIDYPVSDSGYLRGVVPVSEVGSNGPKRFGVSGILPGLLPDFGYLRSVVAVPCEEAQGDALDHFVQVHQRLCLYLLGA